MMRYPRLMLRPQDIVVLLKLAGQEPGWTFEGIGAELDLSPSAVHRSLDRAKQSGFYKARSKAVNRAALLEFLVHGAKYVFPAVRQGEARHPDLMGRSAAGGSPFLVRR